MDKATQQIDADHNFKRALELITTMADLLEVSRNLTVLWNEAYKARNYANMDSINAKRKDVAKRMLEL